MLKTSKATQPKSITTSRTKVKVITTSSTRKSRSETTSITNKKLLKPSTTTPFTSLCTPPTSSSPSSLPTTTTTSPTTTTSKSLLYPTLSLPPSSLPTSTSSSLSSSLSSLSSLSKFISLPFTTIFNSQSQSQQQPQQESQLESFIITPHLHQQFNDPFYSLTGSFQRKINNPFHSLTRPFQHKLLSQSNVFHSTKVQLKDANEHTTPSSNGSSGIKFEFLTSDEFKAAMKQFLSHFQDDLDIPLATFIAAVEKYYPSEPLGFVANFIRVNRTIFKQLFRHQIIKSIPSLKGNTTEQDEIDAKQAEIDEIVEIIFQWYQNIPTLISKLRDKGYTDKDIGALRDLYPAHFHSKIDDALSSKDSTQKTQHVQYSTPQSTHAPRSFLHHKVNGVDLFLRLYDSDLEKDFHHVYHQVALGLQSCTQVDECVNKIMNEFETNFIQLPKIKSLLQRHKSNNNSPSHQDQLPNLSSFESFEEENFYFPDQLTVQEIHNDADLSWSPILQLIHAPVTLSSREASVLVEEKSQKGKTDDSPGEKQRKAMVNYLTEAISILSTNISQTTSTQSNQFHINPLGDNHLAFSYQQCLLLTTSLFIINKYLGNTTTKQQELIFQFTTGHTYTTYCASTTTAHKKQVPCIVGPSGIGKSFLLYIIWLYMVFHSIQTNSKDQVIILTLGNYKETDEFCQIRFEWKGDKPTIEISNKRNTSAFPNQKVIVLNDIPDSPLSRATQPLDASDSQDTSGSQAKPQQNPRIEIPVAPLLEQEGLELQFISAQERFMVPTITKGRTSSKRYPWSSPTIIKRALSPIFLPTPPSFLQTILSLLKSSLFQYRFPSPKLPSLDETMELCKKNSITLLPATTTQQQQQQNDMNDYLKLLNALTQQQQQNDMNDYLKLLNALTIHDLIHIGFFSEWDNGKSLFNSQQDPVIHDGVPIFQLNNSHDLFELAKHKTNPGPVPNHLKVKIYPSFLQFESLYDEQYNKAINTTENDRQTSQDRFNNIIQQTFHLQSNDQERIQLYQDSIFKQLRLLPYVSPSMRSASTLYRQIQVPTTPLLQHYDFLTRFIPISYVYLQEQWRKLGHSIPPHIRSLTQVSSLLQFAAPDLYEPFFEHSFFLEEVVAKEGVRYQGQLDYIPSHYDKYFRFYSTKGLVTILEKVYDSITDVRFNVTFKKITTPSTIYTSKNCITSQPELFAFLHPSRSIEMDMFIGPDEAAYKQYMHMNFIIADAVQFVKQQCKDGLTVSVSISTSIVKNYPVFDRAYISIRDDKVLLVCIQETTSASKKINPSDAKKAQEDQSACLTHLNELLGIDTTTPQSDNDPIDIKLVVVGPNCVTVSNNLKVDGFNHDPEIFRCHFIHLPTIKHGFM